MQATQETQVPSLYQEDFWRRKWQPTSVFLPGKSRGQRNLVGYSPWGYKESDTTEHACTQDAIKPKVQNLVRGSILFPHLLLLIKRQIYPLPFGANYLLPSPPCSRQWWKRIGIPTCMPLIRKGKSRCTHRSCWGYNPDIPAASDSWVSLTSVSRR